MCKARRLWYLLNNVNIKHVHKRNKVSFKLAPIKIVNVFFKIHFICHFLNYMHDY